VQPAVAGGEGGFLLAIGRFALPASRQNTASLAGGFHLSYPVLQ
jgi:hypothetical protein